MPAGSPIILASLLLRTTFPDAFFLDLLDLSVYSELFAHPDRLEALASPHKPTRIVIDEVQRTREIGKRWISCFMASED